jgi:DNA-binding NarL/FixJ family response regulator
MIPLIVVEGPEELLGTVLSQLQSESWIVVRGWTVPPRSAKVVCTGVVSSEEDAARALLAAVAGAGLAVSAQAPREVIDRLCDDLRRFGRVDHRVHQQERASVLTREEEGLVRLMLDGFSLGDAARRLHLSRRTADRRMASIRAKLGASSSAEALLRIKRSGF